MGGKAFVCTPLANVSHHLLSLTFCDLRGAHVVRTSGRRYEINVSVNNQTNRTDARSYYPNVIGPVVV